MLAMAMSQMNPIAQVERDAGIGYSLHFVFGNMRDFTALIQEPAHGGIGGQGRVRLP